VLRSLVQPYDGWTDLRVLPAPVNVDGGWTDSVAVTPDGCHLWFGYSRNDFTEFFAGVNQMPPHVVLDPSGPVRPGMTGTTFQIFRADLSSAGWSETYWSNNDPAKLFASASVNAAQDLLVFSNFVGAASISELQYSALSNGAWSAPTPLPHYAASPAPGEVGINTSCDGGDDNGFIIGSLAAQVTLFWESRRSSPDGSACGSNRHLYRSIYTSGVGWSAIAPIPGLNELAAPESDDSQVSFAPDASDAYWTSIRSYQGVPTYGIFTAHLDGSSYAGAHPIVVPTSMSPFANKLVILGELNVATLPQGRIGYFMCGVAQTDDPHAQVVLQVCRMKQPI